MVEVVKHSLGFCGEHWHPNIWTLLLGGFGMGAIYSYIKLYLKCKIKKAFAYTRNTWHKFK